MSGSSVDKLTFIPKSNQNTHSEVFGEGVVLLFEDDFVVGKRTHRHPYLRHVEEIVDEGVLVQLDPVADAVGEHEARDQVVDVPAGPAVRSELKSVQLQTRAQHIQVLDVRVQVVQVVHVRRVVIELPLARRHHQLLQSQNFVLGLVVHAVETRHRQKETVNFRVLFRV
jgi:hypothetical protein